MPTKHVERKINVIEFCLNILAPIAFIRQVSDLFSIGFVLVNIRIAYSYTIRSDLIFIIKKQVGNLMKKQSLRPGPVSHANRSLVMQTESYFHVFISF